MAPRGGGSATTSAENLTTLARLATDTGGRYTERSNDLTLGYARAQRDAGCVYTLGLYVSDAREDRPRDLTVRVKRPGLRAIHPSRYVFRSPAKKRESLLRAAWVAPEMFQSGVVRAYLFPLRPASRQAWDALLAVRFTVPLAGSEGETVQREFGAVLGRGSGVVHRFDRSLRLTPDGPEVTSTPEVTFLEPVTVGPGRYTLTTVVTDLDGTETHAEKIAFEVPEVPRKEVFVVDPILGRPAGGDLVIRGRGIDSDEIGDENSFLPLLVRKMDRPEDLVALSQACWVGGKRGPRGRWQARASIVRRVELDGFGDVGDLDAVPLDLAGSGPIRCQNVLDMLPGGRMPDGDYVFEAAIGGTDDALPRRVEFAIDETPSADAGSGGAD